MLGSYRASLSLSLSLYLSYSLSLPLSLSYSLSLYLDFSYPWLAGSLCITQLSASYWASTSMDRYIAVLIHCYTYTGNTYKKLHCYTQLKTPSTSMDRYTAVHYFTATRLILIQYAQVQLYTATLLLSFNLHESLHCYTTALLHCYTLRIYSYTYTRIRFCILLIYSITATLLQVTCATLINS